jgi:hypothetical protein
MAVMCVAAMLDHKPIEILGDLDQGLEIKSEVRERLIRQRQEVMDGERGRPFGDVVREVARE